MGAGASVHAGYPLASRLLQALSDWLDGIEQPEPWVQGCRNRILQVRETFGAVDDFEGILGKLDRYGQQRVKPVGPTSYRQDYKDIFHDWAERMRGVNCPTPAQGFYPQYLRADLITALREFFYQTEQGRTPAIAYDAFAKRRIEMGSAVLTLNYDVALERALVKVGKWDIGNGYGYDAFEGRDPSPTTLYKLHGSVNWFQTPLQENPPPVMFARDLALLGYKDLTDGRIGGNSTGINNAGTVILPDPNKEFFWERFWSPLWNAAAARLRKARQVFIHGYSMPQADVKARELLLHNIASDARIAIYCRGDSDRIAEEFRRFGFADVSAFRTVGFEDWARAKD